jgi:hypothetical protein
MHTELVVGVGGATTLSHLGTGTDIWLLKNEITTLTLMKVISRHVSITAVKVEKDTLITVSVRARFHEPAEFSNYLQLPQHRGRKQQIEITGGIINL